MGISFLEQKKTICLDGNLVDLSTPVVMGVVNITPDSFYSRSRISDFNRLFERVDNIVEQGCGIVDIGGYSSRPNAQEVSEEEEIRRVAGVVETIKKRYPSLPISLDTFRSNVVKAVYNQCGGVIVNDISAGEMDEGMFETVAELRLPYIAMHMKGTPANMQENPTYSNIRHDIFNYFSSKVERLRLMGVSDVIIDPGFGFGKTIDHNYQILKILEEFKSFKLPVLVGFSRKSMIYNLLGVTPDEALTGTTVLNTIALLKGASILRVHDVKEAVETIALVNKLHSSYITL